MAITQTVGESVLRKEVVDAMVKQIAARAYKFRQAFAVVSTNAWTNTFYREDLAVSAGPEGNKFKGIPRGANFPTSDVKWEKVSVSITKFGSEANIIWEDILANDINVQARTLIRKTEDIVKAVDDANWEDLTEGRTLTGRIQSFAIVFTGNEAHGRWDQASAAIVDDMMKASELISTNGNYDVGNLICFVSPRDNRSLKNYIADKGAQWQGPATDVLTNGRTGKIAGIQIVESNSVTASYALVVKPKTCATWKSLVSLRTNTTDDPFKSWRVRIVEEGVTELTDPLAIVLIGNTQSP